MHSSMGEKEEEEERVTALAGARTIKLLLGAIDVANGDVRKKDGQTVSFPYLKRPSFSSRSLRIIVSFWLCLKRPSLPMNEMFHEFVLQGLAAGCLPRCSERPRGQPFSVIKERFPSENSFLLFLRG